MSAKDKINRMKLSIEEEAMKHRQHQDAKLAEVRACIRAIVRDGGDVGGGIVAVAQGWERAADRLLAEASSPIEAAAAKVLSECASMVRVIGEEVGGNDARPD